MAAARAFTRQRVPRFNLRGKIRVRRCHSVDAYAVPSVRCCRWRKKPLSARAAPGGAPAALYDLVQHGLKRAVVGHVLGDPLGHEDQMVVRYGDLTRVAEQEASALEPKARDFFAPRQLIQTALLQTLQPSRQIHPVPDSARQWPLPARPALRSSRSAQRFPARSAPDGAVAPAAYQRSACSESMISQALAAMRVEVDRHAAQLHHALLLRPLKHLGKRVVQRAFVAAPETRSAPSFPTCLACRKIAKRKIFHQSTLHLPRAGDAQRVGVEPHTKHQLRSVKLPALGAVVLLGTRSYPIAQLRHGRKSKRCFSPNSSSTLGGSQ